MKTSISNKFDHLKKILAFVTGAALALPVFAQEPSAPLAGLSVRDGKLLDSYGKPFIFRGVTIDHTLAPEKTLQAIRDIATAGANSAQIELSLYPDPNLFPRLVVAQVREIIAECKANKLICVLEPNDAAGYPHYTRVNSDLLGFWTWPDMLAVLEGNQAHIILGLGNQHFAGGSPSEYEYRMHEYANALVNGLPPGFVVMIDGDNWAEDTSKLMFELAKRLKTQASDLSKQLIYSVDMFYSYQDPTRVHDYIASFSELDAPLVIGGFAQTPYYHPHRPTPLHADAPQIPVTSIMQYAEQYGAGYFGWSWSGNENPFLDLVTNYDASALTSWGKLLFNDVNGIKATAKRASIYDNTSSSSSSISSISSTSSASSISSTSSVSSNSSSSVQANRPPVVDFFASNYPAIFCGSPNAGQGRITAQATGSYDPDGDPLTYFWSGPGATASGETATFTSWSGRSYQISLTVTDSHGASASLVRNVAPFYLDCPFSSASSRSLSSSSSILSSPSSSSSRSSSSSKYSSSSRSSYSSTSSRSSSPNTSSSSSSLPFIQGICTYQVQSQWGSGFTATIRLKNASSLPMNGWDVKWQYPDSSKVTNLWNAKLAGTNPYSAKNLDWNATIQPGQTVEFGFQGSKPAGPAVTPAFTGTVCLPTIIQ